jgi:hypothetical protein
LFDVTLLADTSGNNLGSSAYDAVAIGINLQGGSLLSAMEVAPNGAANWTAQGGGLNAGGCNGTGAFICASANSSAFAATTPNASTATTPYEWSFEVSIPDNIAGGAASVFSSPGGVKVHYTTIQGHLVSDDFSWVQQSSPGDNSPEPASIILLGTLLVGVTAVWRKKAQQRL